MTAILIFFKDGTAYPSFCHQSVDPYTIPSFTKL
jgi:hypothetical protein